MLRIFLIRHGATEWNKESRLQGTSDIHLSTEGFHQAITLAEHVPFTHVEAIYSSDLARAMETAKIIAERFNLTVKPMPELREMNYGDWEGRLIRRPSGSFSPTRKDVILRTVKLFWRVKLA